MRSAGVTDPREAADLVRRQESAVHGPQSAEVANTGVMESWSGGVMRDGSVTIGYYGLLWVTDWLPSVTVGYRGFPPGY